MVPEDVFVLGEPLEPEGREVGQDHGFAGNAVRQHDIKSGRAIGGDDQQRLAEVIDVPDLSTGLQPYPLEPGLQDNRSVECDCHLHPLLAKCGQRFQPRAKLTENRASRQEKTAANSATMRPVKLVSNPPNPFESQYRELLEPPPSVKVQIYEDDTRSILSHNDRPDLAFRWSLNPYRGCFHACAYCYARPSHEYLGFGAGTDFESKLVVKRNAAALLREVFLKPSWIGELVVFSGVTDCYQPVEASLGLTRACLEVCAEFRNPVAIITKGALVLRDLDLLRRLHEEAALPVFLSIPFADDPMARKGEPQAPSITKRLATLKTIAEAGIPPGVAIAPGIPGLNDDHMFEILQKARAAGARTAFYSLLRLPGSVGPVFL